MKKELIKIIQSAFTILLLAIAFSCQKNMNNDNDNLNASVDKAVTAKDFKNFVQINLVGNNNTYSPMNVDANLVNAWGISFLPSGPACVALEGKGICANYNFDGIRIGNPVSIPYAGNSGTGHPTGHAINPTSDFRLPDGTPAQLIFATADGTVSGWNNDEKTAAVKKIDNSPAASYFGITMASEGSDFFVYVANFGQNRIDVFDKNWNAVSKPFVDPELPLGYAPVNIETISDGKLYVMYAKKNAEGKVDAGPGNGYINVFSPNGTLLKRFASKGKLDAPWGITKAPAGFWGEWSQIPNLILVANSGDGHINIFDENGNYLSQLSTKGKPVEIDGLWGITFPPVTAFNRYYMYFSAGPNNGTSGLVGYIRNAYIN